MLHLLFYYTQNGQTVLPQMWKQNFEKSFSYIKRWWVPTNSYLNQETSVDERQKVFIAYTKGTFNFIFLTYTGKSMSEALIFASINP